ncbi:excisionase family DNA-binding protein [Megasphaera sueciensis]|uniref:excisionase family DNA-binding protein n=1 Tax=Megasphaera sueciensis TaxID=349094 RepID=UPI003D022E88
MKALAITKTVLHVSDVACLMNCSSGKVCNLIRSGNLNAYKVGKARLIMVDALDDYLHVESHR